MLWGRAFLQHIRTLLCALAMAIAAPAIAADPLPPPTGPVILSVTGNVEVTNADGRADFDREMLTDLGLTTLRTATAWTDGVQEFEGVLLKSVLERVGAEGTMISATALNDFVAPVPMEEVERYDVILAMKRNGTEMAVSDRGPLWIVYPRDDFPELLDPKFNDRWVWQLRTLDIK
jgi:hypothetical protein